MFLYFIKIWWWYHFK